VIGDDRGGQQVLGVGDRLEGLGELIEVTSAGARFLGDDGQEVFLPLIRRHALPLRGVEEVDRGVWVVDRRAVEERLARVDRLMQEVRAEPVYDGGRVAGLRLAYLADGSLLRSLGFEEGDTVRSVGGRRLDSFDQAYLVYLDLLRRPEVEVTLFRDGRPLTFRYRFR